MDSEQRLEKLREKMEDEELEAMLISSPESRRYFSGFAGSAGYLLITPSDAILATDFRYIEQAGASRRPATGSSASPASSTGSRTWSRTSEPPGSASRPTT